MTQYSKRLINIIDNLPSHQQPSQISSQETIEYNHNKHKIDNIYKEFDIDNKINSIMTLYRLIGEMRTSSRKAKLLKQFMFELDNTINNLEQKYYQQVLRNKCENNIKTTEEKEIYNSHKVLETIMPYALLYMLNNPINE